MSEQKDIIDTNRKRKLFKIVLFLSIIITSIGIFLASYYSSINKVYDSYKTTLVTNINGINEVNTKAAKFSSKQTIAVDYAKQQLPSIIKDLSKFRDNLANSKPTSKYKKDHENLKLGLDKNLLIYRQALALLNNPSGKDVEKSTESLKTYRNDCTNFYSLVDIHNIKIALPQTSLDFINNVLNYSFTALRIRKETDIKSQQNQEFTSEMDGLSTDFLSVKTNYYSYVMKVRKKEMSYDDLLSLVDANFTKLSKVQTNFKNLSIPPSAIPAYGSFKNSLDIYDVYLRDFKLALISEKIQALSAAVDSTALNSLYTSSNALFDKVQSSYNDFIKVYTELNNKK